MTGVQTCALPIFSFCFSLLSYNQPSILKIYLFNAIFFAKNVLEYEDNEKKELVRRLQKKRFKSGRSKKSGQKKKTEMVWRRRMEEPMYKHQPITSDRI